MSRQPRKHRPQPTTPPVAASAEAQTDRLDAPTEPSVLGWRLRLGFHTRFGLLLALVIAALYGRTLDFPMQFDDGTYLSGNPIFHDPSSFSYPTRFYQFINEPAKRGLDPDLAVNFALRPVAYASFALNHWLDGFQPRWYRLGNLLIHFGASLLVSSLAWQLLASSQRRSFIAGAAGLLFAVHPMAIESVTYITQRFTSLGALLSLAALVLYLHSTAQPGRNWLRWSAGGLMLAAMLTKEDSATLPLLAVLLDVLVRRRAWSQVLREALPLLLCLPVVPIMVMACSWALEDGQLAMGKAMHIVNSREQPFDHGHFATTQLTVVLSYLRRLLWPTGLNLDPEWPLYESLLAWPVLRALLVFGLWLGLAGWAMRRWPQDARARCALGFSLWFFITVSISSGLVPLPDLMAEHRAYLPSIGLIIALVCALDAVLSPWTRNPSRLGLSWAVVGTAVLALSVSNWQRNEVWRNELSLWEDTAAKSPNKFRVLGNLGTIYSSRGRHDEAIDYCRRAIEREPRFVPASVLLASLYDAKGQHKEALAETERLIKANPRAGYLGDVHYNAGVALLNDPQRLADGERILRQNLADRPTHWQSHLALSLLHQARGQIQQAIEQANLAAQFKPDHPGVIKLLHDLRQQQELSAR